MKKNYESPKAEKVEFNYTDAVVASDIISEEEQQPTVAANGATKKVWKYAGVNFHCKFDYYEESACTSNFMFC